MIHASAAKVVALGAVAIIAGAVVKVSETSRTIAAGCGANGIPVAVDVGQAVMCVENVILAQVQAGKTTFEEIALAVGVSCGPITAVEVENIVNLWTGSSTTDAGTLPLGARTPEMQAKLKSLKHKGQ